MFTANTMAAVGEALGLSLPGSASAPAVDRRRDDYAYASGTAVLNLLRRNIRPRDIITKGSLLNAIAVVKEALEDAGFALPEPIYRLRFDARTTPLPFEQVEHGAVREESVKKKKRSPTPSTADLGDVSPSKEIAEMVADERRAAPADQERDLLDPARPVE